VDPSPRPGIPPNEAVIDGVVVRVATFNARHGAGRFGITSSRLLVETCRSLDADVLCLQEVDRRVVRSWFQDQVKLVAERLSLRHVVAPAKRTPVGGYQCNALAARGALDDVATVELPRRRGDERRVVVLARALVAGAEVSVACTHLQHRGGAGREQLAAALETLCARPAPHVLAGDFNLGPDEVEPILAARGFRAAGSGPTFPARGPRRRIDYIAAGPGLRIGPARLHAALVSDHLPVVADVVVPPP
jgi:endonuclease/exonuclease/phosphatase family metal-dependent hydrolase